jgi:hypothetical protein
MNYQHDEVYKKNLNSIENEMDAIMTKITQYAETVSDDAKEISEEQKNEVLSLWNHIAHTYHDTLADLKKRFDVMEDDVLAHKMKSFLHKAKEA